jgi:NAD(P)H-hydrate epimerase
MSLPVLTVAQMRAWEKATWAAGVREADVIARVGQRVAERVRQWLPAGARVLLLSGLGNNGNDVRAARLHLGDYQADQLDVTSPSEAQAELVRLLALRPALVVDGLFGIGLNRPLSPEWRQLIETVNASGLPVLAVDVPSGLDADTGGHFGAVVQATVTLTVGVPKRGLIQEAATGCVGRLEVATDVGLLPDPDRVVGEQTGLRCEDSWKFRQAWTVAADFEGFPPRRRVDSHKGTYGHLVLIAGSLGYHGAAVLSAKAAGSARPGLVTVFTSAGAYPAVAAQLAFAMVRPWNEPIELPAKTSAVLVGPGLAGGDVPDGLRAKTLKWWRELRLPLVLDASALDWMALEHRAWWDGMTTGDLAAEAPIRGDHTWHHHVAPRVITPHPGEAARWFSGDLMGVGDRSGIVEQLGGVAGIAVLKGHQTLVRGADEPTFINSTGNPGLAQGGTGDVLAGFLGGLLAQPAWQRDPMLTSRYAVWEHGAAADRLEAIRRNWTAEDLAAEIGR